MNAKPPHGFYGLPSPGAADKTSANKICTPAQLDALLDIGVVISARLTNPLAEHPEQLVDILPVLLLLAQNDPMPAELKTIQLRHRHNLLRPQRI